MTRLLAVVRKEFREIRRDPLLLWIAVAVPVVLLFLFGYAISLDIRSVPLAVLDLDRTAESRALVDAFTNTGDFVVRARLEEEEMMWRLLDRGTIRVALVIPADFSHDLTTHQTPTVQTVIDGSFSARALVIRNEVEATTLAFSAARASTRDTGPASPPVGIRAQPRVWYNASLESATFVVPGLFSVILLAFPPLLTALAIVREKETGSIQQIYVSPLTRWEFLAGKMAPYVAIAFGELLLVIALGTWWFRLPLRGSSTVLLAGSVLYVFCTVAIGILVSTLTRNQVVAILLAIIVTIMPSFLYSGFLYPISSMSFSAQLRTYLFPGRYYVEISRGTFLKGTGFGELGAELAILALYGAIVFGAAAFRFRKKVA
jgi:ABC-2 type transport system permease protein